MMVLLRGAEKRQWEWREEIKAPWNLSKGENVLGFNGLFSYISRVTEIFLQ